MGKKAKAKAKKPPHNNSPLVKVVGAELVDGMVPGTPTKSGRLTKLLGPQTLKL